MTTTPLLVLLGLLDKALTKVAVVALPWSSRSIHSAWEQGYREGLKDGTTRRELLGGGR